MTEIERQILANQVDMMYVLGILATSIVPSAYYNLKDGTIVDSLADDMHATIELLTGEDPDAAREQREAEIRERMKNRG